VLGYQFRGELKVEIAEGEGARRSHGRWAGQARTTGKAGFCPKDMFAASTDGH
jgi:hypothetical protein